MELESKYPSKTWNCCPYCGSDYISWDGAHETHKMRCFKCNNVFYINAAAAVIALIFNSKNELLLVRRKNDPYKGALDLPGGFSDLLETAEDTVVREVKEELNINVVDVKYYTSIPNRYPFGGTVYFTMDLVFVCKPENTNEINAADDITDYVFLPVEKIDVDEIGLESVKILVNKMKLDENPINAFNRKS